jgi:tetratricopeptide (TPR) repeat protein
MTKRRAISLLGVTFLAVAGVAAALLLTNQREVTTSSDAAYRVYREAVANERAFYVKDARLGFAKALELDPDFVMAMLGLARLSEGAGQKEQSLSLIHRAERLKNRVNERERLQIDLHLAALEKTAEERLKIAREILRRYPDDFRATTTVAMDEVKKGRMEEAVRLFTKLLEVDPNSADAYNQIGYYYGFRGDYEKAIENLKKYQFMAPDQANPHDSLGEIQAYSGHYDEAIANLNRALSIKPDFFPAYDHLGVAYEGKGDYEKAIESYLKAAENVPVEEGKFFYLAKALRATLEKGDVERATDIHARMEKLPKTEHSDLWMAVISTGQDLIQRRPADAERKLEELKPRIVESIMKQKRPPGYKPYEAGWNHLMALAKAALGKESEAIPLYEEMANPPNGWSNFEDRRNVYEGRAELAALLAKRGELERAEKLLEENKRWNPSWSPTRPAETTVAEVRRARVLASAK